MTIININDHGVIWGAMCGYRLKVPDINPHIAVQSANFTLSKLALLSFSFT